MKHLYIAGAVCAALLSLSSSASPRADNFFVIDGMQVEWAYEGDELTFKLHSPYQGWLALGFNANNDIVSSNLVMGAVDDKGVRVEEFYVVGHGNQQPVQTLGGEAAVNTFLGIENAGGTSFHFSINTQIQDAYRYDLREGSKIWLICAYSMQDDFGHHAIMRRHVQVTL